MDIEFVREYCLTKVGSSESMPFGDETLVMKVMDKVYALISLEGDLRINLKCDPERAIELREEYPSIQPGYHMNKKHWNTITIEGELSDQELRHWIKHSYDLVVAKLPKKDRIVLQELEKE